MVGCCDMRAAMALCACDGSALAAGDSVESCFDGRGAAAAPPFCDASALAAAAPPFREGSLMLLRGGSGPTLLPLGLGLVCLLRCSKPVFDAGGIGATLPVLGPAVTALPVLGLVLAISSDTQARRAVRPDSCISSAEDGTDREEDGVRSSDQPQEREVAQHSAFF
eukprot:scaffold16478_cov58-Phaeocystis_antarctica.AAC.1